MKKGEKRKRPTHKCQLTKDVKDRLLDSERLMGAVAELTSKATATLKRQIEEDNQMLTYPIPLDAIKSVLGLPKDAVIYERVKISTITTKKV